jgi:hypothetical protein
MLHSFCAVPTTQQFNSNDTITNNQYVAVHFLYVTFIPCNQKKVPVQATTVLFEEKYLVYSTKLSVTHTV